MSAAPHDAGSGSGGGGDDGSSSERAALAALAAAAAVDTSGISGRVTPVPAVTPPAPDRAQPDMQRRGRPAAAAVPAGTGGSITASQRTPAAPSAAATAGWVRSWQCAALAAVVFALAASGMLAYLGLSFRALVAAPAGGGSSVRAAASATAAAVSSAAASPAVSPSPAAASSSPSRAPSTSPPPQLQQTLTAYTASGRIPTGFRVVRTYPHDGNAFTQGLVWHKGRLLEGTGLHGSSEVRVVDVRDGGYTVVSRNPLTRSTDFGEGIVVWPGDEARLAAAAGGESTGVAASLPPDGSDKLLQLTWQSGVGYVYNADTLERTDSFRYNVDGWGLTHDGRSLLMTDGTSTLYTWDAATYATTGSVNVMDRVTLPGTTRPVSQYDNRQFGGLGKPLTYLNELEYAHGWLLANVWQSSHVAVIHPSTGAVLAYIDFSSLVPSRATRGQQDVLNGLAYTMSLGPEDGAARGSEPWGGRLWVTGKKWLHMYEVELTGLVDAQPLLDGARRAAAAAAAGGGGGKKARRAQG